MGKRKSDDIPYEIINFDIPQNDEKYNTSIDTRPNYVVDIQNNRKKETLKHFFKTNGIKISLTVFCLYMCFLIVGLCTTEFYVNENNTQQAVVVDYTILKYRKDYKKFKSSITQLRNIMVDITILDIKVANEDISNSEASAQYTKILNTQVDVTIPKMKAMDVQDNNAYLKQELESIFANDIAVYLQKITKALATADASVISEAMAWRESIFQSYETIQTQMDSLASSIKKEDPEFLIWDINKAVLEKDATAILKSE